MLRFVRCIIQRMRDFARRVWSICLSLFGVFLIGSLQALIFLNDKSYQFLVSISLIILALICLVIGVVMLIYDFKTTRRKDSQQYMKHVVF